MSLEGLQSGSLRRLRSSLNPGSVALLSMRYIPWAWTDQAGNADVVAGAQISPPLSNGLMRILER